MLHLFCKGVPFDFFFFFAYFISPLSSFGWLKMTKTLSIQKVLLSTKLPTSDSFRLGEGGEGVVFANYTVCVWVVFYAVVKLVGGHIYTVVQKENSWFEAAKKKKKCLKDHHWQTQVPQLVSLEWCFEVVTWELSRLYSLLPPEPWDLWEVCRTSLLTCRVQRAKAETVLRWWEDVVATPSVTFSSLLI